MARGSRGAAAVLLAVAFAGSMPACSVASPAPASARVSMEAAQRDPHGAWINISTDRGGVAGELLAVEPRAVVVQSSAGFQRVPMGAIRSWSLAWYEADNSGVIGYNVLGTLSTLSHGFWLVFTAPLLWMIPGTAIARSQSGQGYESGENGDPGELDWLAKYARFPAGLPPGFDPTVPPAEGGPGQRCYPNQTCNRGLACDRAVCRPAARPP
jgi:hypothetical protein